MSLLCCCGVRWESAGEHEVLPLWLSAVESRLESRLYLYILDIDFRFRFCIVRYHCSHSQSRHWALSQTVHLSSVSLLATCRLIGSRLQSTGISLDFCHQLIRRFRALVSVWSCVGSDGQYCHLWHCPLPAVGARLLRRYIVVWHSLLFASRLSISLW